MQWREFNIVNRLKQMLVSKEWRGLHCKQPTDLCQSKQVVVRSSVSLSLGKNVYGEGP